MSFKRTSDAATEPVSLTEVKAHLRLTAPGGEAAYTDEDTQLSAFIKAARMMAERYTERSFITQTWVYKCDEFPDTLELLYGPVSSVIITYIDSDGTTQTLSSSEYVTDLNSQIARINPVEEWPETKEILNAVTVTYVAGYGSASDVPQDIKLSMLLVIGKMYQEREETIRKMPTSAEFLLNPHKVYHAL